MHQIAFYIGSHAIHWYGVCAAAGFAAATLILLWKRGHARMTQDQIFDVAMLALFTGFLGARIFYVIQFWGEHFANRSFLEVFRVDKGGLVFYGGFLLAISCVIWYAHRKKISMWLLLDIFSPAIAVAHAFGRIGCFLQGCCFGGPAPAGFPGAVTFPIHTDPWRRYPSLGNCSEALYPVQLYESALNFILCFVLLLLFRKIKRPGQICGIYITAYAVIRFSLEFFRGDHIDHFLGFTPSQTIALFLMLPVGLLMIFFCPKQMPPEPEPAKEQTQEKTK